MLKNRIILLFTFLLLLVGVNVDAIAGVDSTDLVQNETDKEQPGNGPQHESEESITELDFFGAFSLVNIQLQWRDLDIGLNAEEAEAESSVNQLELPLIEVEKLSTDNQDQITPLSSLINNEITVIPVCTYRTITESVDFICSHNKQVTSTIAYILNCGTYPLSC